MSAKSPLKQDEIAFAIRLLFETLHFAEPVVANAEPKLRKIGLNNGAIENILRVMDLSQHEYRSMMYDGPEPAAADVCPWGSQTAFLARNAELRLWIVQRGGEPADIECFVCFELSHEEMLGNEFPKI